MEAKAEPAQVVQLLTEAAQLTQDHLGDEGRVKERALLEAILEIQEENEATSGRLFDLLVLDGELDRATDLLIRGRVSANREFEAGLSLFKALDEAHSALRSAELMAYLADKYPDTREASDHRLSQARRREDSAMLCDELRWRLGHPEMVPEPEEIMSHHTELGRLLHAEGENESALQHFVAASEADALELQDLVAAIQIACEVDAFQSMDILVQRAVARRSEIEESIAGIDTEAKPAWYAVVGLACERMGDSDGMVRAHQKAFDLSEGLPPLHSSRALRQVYRDAGDWVALCTLEERMAYYSSGTEKAEALHQLAVIYSDHLPDEEKAIGYLTESLEVDPEFGAAQLAYGLILNMRGQHEEALPLLQKQIDPEHADTSLEHLNALFTTLKNTGQLEAGASVAVKILEREPEPNCAACFSGTNAGRSGQGGRGGRIVDRVFGGSG